MKYPLYAIRDSKTNFFPPQVEQNESTAIRNFCMMIKQAEGIMKFSPSDFDLYHVGEFDADLGVIEGQTPMLVFSGTDVIGVNYEK